MNIVLTDARFTARPLVADQEGIVLDLYKRCEDFLALGPQPTATLEMVRSDMQLSQQQGGVYCGLYGPAGELFGILDFILQPREGARGQAFIELLMLAPSHRGQGIGKRVVHTLERWLKAQGAESVAAGVQVNNPLACAFWRKMGFAFIAGPELLADGTSVYQLEKQL